MKNIEQIWNEVVKKGDSNSPYDLEIAKAIEQYLYSMDALDFAEWKNGGR